MLYSIIISTFKHLSDQLMPCLESIKKTTILDDNIEIIIVANGCGSDGTREYVESLGKPFKLLWFDEPQGYTHATNEGIKIAQGEYIVLLNNDTEILDYWPRHQWLECLRQPFQDPKVGITGSSRHFSPEAKSYFLIFFCVMIPRRIFNECGILDETYNPGAGEDTSYCMELENRGYKIVQVPENSYEWKYNNGFPIYHKAEQTVHDKTLVPEWFEIYERNGNILKEKYGKIQEAKKIGIIMPVYNAEKFIEKSINSIINQTHKNWTLYICDNNSTDRSLEICENYSKKDSRVQCLSYSDEQGPAQTRNQILNLIRNNKDIQYVAYCDADDSWQPTHLDVSLYFLKTNDIVYSDQKYVFEDGSEAFPYNIPYYSEFDGNNFVGGNFIWISSVVHKKECLSIGDFNPEFNSLEDWDYWWRIYKNRYKFYHNKQKMIIYTVKKEGMALKGNEILNKKIRKSNNYNLKIQVITFCKNEEKMIPYFLRYYETFCDSIIVYDNESTDNSLQLLSAHPKVKMASFKTEGKLNDIILRNLRNEEYKKDRNKYDWEIIVDMDQFVYHNNLLQKLKEYKDKGITIPKIKGYQMYSSKFPTEDKQIYEIISTGQEQHWLDVSAIFNPLKIDINYDIGCHQSNPIGEVKYSEYSDIKLLHYRFLSYEYLIEKCKERNNDLSDINKEKNWGCHYKEFMKITEDEFNNSVMKSIDIINIQYGVGSFIDFKNEIKHYILKNFLDKNTTILDVGPGTGTYFELLKNDYKNIDCVEIHEPNIIGNNLKEKYRNVFLSDIINFEFNTYDIIIMGDILEHINIEGAQKLIKQICHKCKQLIISVPWEYEQGMFYNNPYEIHLQPDLTEDIMKIRYSELYPLFLNKNCGVYIKNNLLIEKKLESQNRDLNHTVTVEISTRNRYFTTLPLAIQSIINQTLKPNRLIIFDD